MSGTHVSSSCLNTLLPPVESDAGKVFYAGIGEIISQASDRNFVVKTYRSLILAISTYAQMFFSMLQFAASKTLTLATHLLSFQWRTAFKNDLVDLITGLFRYIQVELLMPFYMLAGLVRPGSVYKHMNTPNALAESQRNAAQIEMQETTRRAEVLEDYCSRLVDSQWAQKEKKLREKLDDFCFGNNPITENNAAEKIETVKTMVHDMIKKLTPPGFPARDSEGEDVALSVERCEDDCLNPFPTGYRGRLESMPLGETLRGVTLSFCVDEETERVEFACSKEASLSRGNEVFSFALEEGVEETEDMRKVHLPLPHTTDDSFISIVPRLNRVPTREVLENGLGENDEILSLKQFLEKGDLYLFPAVLETAFQALDVDVAVDSSDTNSLSGRTSDNSEESFAPGSPVERKNSAGMLKNSENASLKELYGNAPTSPVSFDADGHAGEDTETVMFADTDTGLPENK